MPKTLYGTQSGSSLAVLASALTRQTILPAVFLMASSAFAKRDLSTMPVAS